MPWMVRELVRVIESGDGSFGTIVWISAILLGAFALRGAFEFLSYWYSAHRGVVAVPRPKRICPLRTPPATLYELLRPAADRGDPNPRHEGHG